MRRFILKTAVKFHRRKRRQQRDEVVEHFGVCRSLHPAGELAIRLAPSGPLLSPFLRCLLFNPTALSRFMGRARVGGTAGSEKEHAGLDGHTVSRQDPLPAHSSRTFSLVDSFDHWLKR